MLACWACGGHGRRVKPSIEHLYKERSNPCAESGNPLKVVDSIPSLPLVVEVNHSRSEGTASANSTFGPLQLLSTLLLAFDPAVAFNPSGVHMSRSEGALSSPQPAGLATRQSLSQAMRTSGTSKLSGPLPLQGLQRPGAGTSSQARRFERGGSSTMAVSSTAVKPTDGAVEKTTVDVQAAATGAKIGRSVQRRTERAKTLAKTANRQLNIKKAADCVKVHLQNILRVQPNWDMYSKDLQVKDRRGNVLGLRSTRKLMGLIRKFYAKCVENHRIDVQTTIIDGDRPAVVATGTVRLRSKSMLFPFPLPSFTLTAEGSSTIHFNNEGKVSSINVDSLRFNGREIEFPVLQWKDSQPDDLTRFSNLAPQDQITLANWVRKVILGC